MLGTVDRRISSLERGIRLPMTAELFWTRAHDQVRRTGSTLDAAFESIARELSDSDLERLGTELEQIVFGGDTAARDEAKRKVLIAAGFGAQVSL
jgi:hypothetical protein